MFLTFAVLAFLCLLLCTNIPRQLVYENLRGSKPDSDILSHSYISFSSVFCSYLGTLSTIILLSFFSYRDISSVVAVSE